jgi:hypothetical protein
MVQQRSGRIALGEANRMSKLMTRLTRPWRRPSAARLPDYLLRDAGLELVAGVIRTRRR